MHKKRIPMRMCTGCGEMKPKPELVRVVKAPDQKDEQGNILAAGNLPGCNRQKTGARCLCM